FVRCRHGLGDCRSEGDHVVLDLVLDFLDAFELKAGEGAQLGRGFGRDFAEFGQCFGGRQLDFEPLTILVVFTPDPAHFGAGVTGDQMWVLCSSVAVSQSWTWGPPAAAANRLRTAADRKRLTAGFELRLRSRGAGYKPARRLKTCPTWQRAPNS